MHLRTLLHVYVGKHMQFHYQLSTIAIWKSVSSEYIRQLQEGAANNAFPPKPGSEH